MLEKGTQLGAFIIDRPLGSGNTGTVYRASSIHNSMTFAIKVLAPELAEDRTVVTMFDEEAKAGMQINHPHIVQTMYVGRHEGVPYMVFEFVKGISLATLIDQGPLREGPCIWILRQMGQALRALHGKGMIHQDIKPENILIDNAGNCKLTDLGFARVPKGKINWDGYAAGTASYMPPEQWRGGKDQPIDGRSDLYALGATLYHAATGAPPFHAEEEDDLAKLHLHEPPQSVHLRNPGISRPFSVILARLLEKLPEDRYPSAEAMLLAIRSLRVTPTPPAVIISRVKPPKASEG